MAYAMSFQHVRAGEKTHGNEEAHDPVRRIRGKERFT